jgi:hypothetical protein
MKTNIGKRRDSWEAFLRDFAEIERIVDSGKRKDELCTFSEVCQSIFNILKNATWG